MSDSRLTNGGSTYLTKQQKARRILNATKVRRIRKAARLRKLLSNKAIAAREGCTVASVRNVLKGQRWAHVE